eukprot:269576-Chlamydomonas_euryale.AAC.1
MHAHVSLLSHAAAGAAAEAAAAPPNGRGNAATPHVRGGSGDGGPGVGPSSEAPIALFESRIIQRVKATVKTEHDGQPSPTAASAASEPGGAVDLLLCTGGLTWALDFCPASGGGLGGSGDAAGSRGAADGRNARSSGGDALDSSGGTGGGNAQRELLAAAVHPGSVTRNRAGQLQSGDGAVQVWEIAAAPRRADAGGGGGGGELAGGGGGGGWGAALPARAAMAIVHPGRVTWDVKWCPSPQRVATFPVSLTTAGGSADAADGTNDASAPRHPLLALCAPPPAAGSATAGLERGREGSARSGGGGGSEGRKRRRGDGAAGGGAAAAGAAAAAVSAPRGAGGGGGHAGVLATVGLLAFVGGDGVVRVVAVPEPAELHLAAAARAGAAAATTAAAAAAEGLSGSASCGMAGGGSGGGSAVGVPAVRLPAQFRLTCAELGGSVPCSLAWQLPGSCAHGAVARQAGVKLLVGCCDGMVAGWQLPGVLPCRAQVLFQIRCGRPSLTLNHTACL